ncbi:MAG: hypothetical protein L7F78_06365 [Syntrophales bacterium LBB04]|nr:hypothetical protein [Syntrophales bacterium LBB04]
MPLCNPKGKDPSGSLRINVPLREVNPRPLGGVLHAIFKTLGEKMSFFIGFIAGIFGGLVGLCMTKKHPLAVRPALPAKILPGLRC